MGREMAEWRTGGLADWRNGLDVAYPCGMSFICYVLMSFWWPPSTAPHTAALSRPPGQNDWHKPPKRPTDTARLESVRPYARPPAWEGPLRNPTTAAASRACVGGCVRACHVVFVIPGSMSSIKIYLSDFSWFTYIDLGYISPLVSRFSLLASPSSQLFVPQINNFYDRICQ